MDNSLRNLPTSKLAIQIYWVSKRLRPHHRSPLVAELLRIEVAAALLHGASRQKKSRKFLDFSYVKISPGGRVFTPTPVRPAAATRGIHLHVEGRQPLATGGYRSGFSRFFAGASVFGLLLTSAYRGGLLPVAWVGPVACLCTFPAIFFHVTFSDCAYLNSLRG